MNEIRALIVEDEPLVAIFIKRVLIKNKITVLDTVYDGEKALQAIHIYHPNLIFMDINIKGALDGISVIRKAKLPKKCHLFYITAYNSLEIIQEAMQTRPNNYLIKPVSEEELIIAIELVKNSMLCEPLNIETNEHHLILGEEIVYNLESHHLIYQGKPVALTNIESKIMQLLVANLNQIVSYDEIKNVVWERKEIANSTLRDAISALRRKLSSLEIENCYAEGYRLHKQYKAP